MSLLSISFNDISVFCQKSIRPVEEGFLLAESTAIAQVACVKHTEKLVKYVASIIQTSDHNAKPHTVELSVELKNENGKQLKKLDGSCSCKANINKCKHIVGLMVKLMNENPKRMDVLSRTDVTQNWGRYASLSLEEFTAKPVEEMKCCYKDKISRVPATVEYPERVGNLLQAFPNSALALALKPTDQQIQSTAASVNTDTTSISYQDIFPENQKSSRSQFRLVGPKSMVRFYYKYVHVECDEASCIFEKSRGQASLYWKLQYVDEKSPLYST